MALVPDLRVLALTDADGMELALKLHATVVPRIAAGAEPESVLRAILRECPTAITHLPARVFANPQRLADFLSTRGALDALN